VRDERNLGDPLNLTFRGELRADSGGRSRGACITRRGRARSDDGIWQDGRCRIAHRETGCQHAGVGAPAATTRSVGRATVGVPGHSREVRWQNWRWRRLVRDGVDVPLAELFVQSARPTPPDIDGVNRARSASEAFLSRRLETLAETKGRFEVNVSLPIAFNGAGSLEVDLLCADARVAVEIDGSQHLADPAAYRRDRRKDHLLQEQGYLGLRFLAEDVGKEFDLVLDRIQRALSHRRTTIRLAVMRRT
jgi:hypothetical protein